LRAFRGPSIGSPWCRVCFVDPVRPYLMRLRVRFSGHTSSHLSSIVNKRLHLDACQLRASEVPPLCRETQSLGQQMLELSCENATVGTNGLILSGIWSLGHFCSNYNCELSNQFDWKGSWNLWPDSDVSRLGNFASVVWQTLGIMGAPINPTIR